jgi:GT2 family glycosyltransferase
VRLAICTPVYGRHDLTDALVAQLAKEAAYVDVYLCDNLGSYERSVSENANIRVLRPGTNLGWVRGSNLALRAAAAQHSYDAYVLLNNDVVLSRDFCGQLFQGAVESGADVVGPVYDDIHRHQALYHGRADAYRPRAEEAAAPFVDGTCLLLTATAYARLGGLDEAAFSGRFGWGADIDYGIRARRAGLGVAVTRRAFLNHIRGATARDLGQYERSAIHEYCRAMSRRYGRLWGRHLALSKPRASLLALRFALLGAWLAMRLDQTGTPA